MTKTKGIRVIWPTEEGGREIDEIEYFYGLDVKRLDDVPEFTKKLTRVQSFWPRYDRLVEYVVDAAATKAISPTKCASKSPTTKGRTRKSSNASGN